MARFGIYVHIPFCKKKCDYCDFVSFPYGEEMQRKYVDAVLAEIEYRSKNDGAPKEINTIYFGGGTPSFINHEEIIRILDKIKSLYKLAPGCEITIEVNPGTVSREKLRAYKLAGINRLSIGLQSTSDRLLKLIGRIHTYDEFLKTYDEAIKASFTNINVDLMLALPTQTMDELMTSVNEVIKLNPNHISLYSLIVEEGTPLSRKVENGEYELLPEDMERKMYWKTKKLLEKNGYNHYEISNFSKPGYESKHNSDCWNQEEYIGFGLAAHSYIGGIRKSNIESLDEYIKNIENKEFDKNVTIHEKQDRESTAKEYMMLGLRKIEGVSISAFERKFGINPLFYFRFEIEKLVNEEIIEVDLDSIKLTKKGLDVANQAFEEFV